VSESTGEIPLNLATVEDILDELLRRGNAAVVCLCTATSLNENLAPAMFCFGGRALICVGMAQLVIDAAKPLIDSGDLD
jgi:hypothetical protein